MTGLAASPAGALIELAFLERPPEVSPVPLLHLFRRRSEGLPESLGDGDLLRLFDSDPHRAWDLFLERYADFLLTTLRRLGFGHDAAMDRFVHVCEKLCEDDFRRLRGVRFAGQRGELVPWLREVTANLARNWTWSTEGRLRWFKSIAALGPLERRVFELHFWHGLGPSRILEALLAERFEENTEMTLDRVFEALENVFNHLDANQLWRLASRLLRRRPAVAVARGDPETGLAFEPPAAAADPERRLIEKERREALSRALGELPARERLILQLRYEETLGLAEVAEIVGVSPSTVKASLRSSRERLRQRLLAERETKSQDQK